MEYSLKFADPESYNQMTSITLFMLVINLGGSTIPWSSSANPILLVFSVITTLAFFQHEKRVKLPVLPINLLTNRRMVPQVGLNLFGAMTIFGVSLISTNQHQLISHIVDTLSHTCLFSNDTPDLRQCRISPSSVSHTYRPNRFYCDRDISSLSSRQMSRRATARSY